MKKFFTKSSKVIISTLAGLFIYASVASAHVSVKPQVSAPGAWETYTIKVPVEKDVNTTKITLKVPTGVELVSYQPVPDWKVTLDKDTSGKIKTITWIATDIGIAAGQFQQFYFVAKNPEMETQVAWDAYQYYKDGSVVKWTGNESSDSPHSITQVTAAPSNVEVAHDDHHHDTKIKTTQTEKAVDNTKSEKSGSQTTVITLSILAIILSVVSLIITFRRK